MIRKLQNKEILFVMIISVLIGICGGFLLIDVGPWALKAIKGCASLEGQTDLAHMEGSYVSYEAKCPMGQYMEITRTIKGNDGAAETEKERASYVVMDEARGLCLSVQVPAAKCEKMEKLVEEFYDALYQETRLPAFGVTVKGSLDRLEGEELGYFRQAMEEVGLSAGTEVYHISDEMIHGNELRSIYIRSFAGIILAGLAVVFLLLSVKELVGRR